MLLFFNQAKSEISKVSWISMPLAFRLLLVVFVVSVLSSAFFYLVDHSILFLFSKLGFVTSK